MTAVRSFIGHFAPHLAALWFVYSAWLDLDQMLEAGTVSHSTSLSDVGAWDWFAVLFLVIGMLAALAVIGGYVHVRSWHASHACSWCDRNGHRWGNRPRRSPLAWLFDARHTRPGGLVMIVLFVASLVVLVFSPLGALCLDVGLALGLASTVAHQARERACPTHTKRSVVFQPGTTWGGSRQVLIQLHARMRGASSARIVCTWCLEERAVTYPLTEALPWMWRHIAVRCRFHQIGGQRDAEFLTVKVIADPVDEVSEKTSTASV